VAQAPEEERERGHLQDDQQRMAPAEPQAGVVTNWRTIDVHHHLVPPVYFKEVDPLFHLHEPLRRWSPERSIEDMERAGVASAILSVTTPGFWFKDVALARRLTRASNEYAAGLVAKYPGRFGMFAALPLPDIEGSLAELAYGLDVLKADGIGLFTSYRDCWLGDPRFEPVMEELNRRKALVYTHPNVADCCVNLIPDVSPPQIEYQTDTTRAIANMIFSGATVRHADIRFIWSHAGGTMPFLLERFVNMGKDPKLAQRLPHGVMHEITKCFYDTAQTSNRICMHALSQVVETSQILFGTDYPYRTSLDHVKGLAGCHFGQAELRQIHRENALLLLPRFGD
jgi:predicted TIM-barrel fold metal-dependent hydrolase